MTENKNFYEKYNLSEEELSEKSNKNVYVRNDVLNTIIKRYRGGKKRGERKIDEFEKKINDSRI